MKIEIRCKAKVLLPIDSIESIQGDLKSISPARMAKLKNSLREHGFSFPVFVWENKGRYYSIDGIHRLKALRELKSEGHDTPSKVPVSFIEARDMREAKKLLLAASSQYAEFEQDEFIAFASDLDLDFLNNEIVIPGISIDEFMNAREDVRGVDVAPPPPKNPETNSGDLYQLSYAGPLGDMVHRVVCGDARDRDVYDKLLGDKKIDLVFTDPPYNIDIGGKEKTKRAMRPGDRKKGSLSSLSRPEAYIENDKMKIEDFRELLVSSFTNAAERLNDYNSFYVCYALGFGLGVVFESAINSVGMITRHVIIWEKNRPSFSFNRLDYDYLYEPILYGWKGRHKFYGKGEQKYTIWKYDSPVKSELHLTMKPVDLIKNAILNSSLAGMSVLDMFLGSGSTLIACIETGRPMYGIEIDKANCDISIRRALNYLETAGIAYTLKRNGKPFKFKTEG